MKRTKCQFCRKVADRELTLNKLPICRICAHNASHAFRVMKGDLPCPVVNEAGEVLPYGVWPNIDLS